MSLFESIAKEVGAMKAERIMDIIADWQQDEPDPPPLTNEQLRAMVDRMPVNRKGDT